MRQALILILLCDFLPARILAAKTIDSLAISVGTTVITELQIDEDLRVAAILNDSEVRRDDESRRSAADRLVDQLLIQHEIAISRYPPPSAKEVDTLYLSVQNTLGGEQRFMQLLWAYQLEAQTVRSHLLTQLATLQFIEFRFRPDVNVSDQDIDQAYQRLIATRQAGTLEAALPAASERAKLSQKLIAERTDAALNSWLAESRKQVNIRYIDATLK